MSNPPWHTIFIVNGKETGLRPRNPLIPVWLHWMPPDPAFPREIEGTWCWQDARTLDCKEPMRPWVADALCFAQAVKFLAGRTGDCGSEGVELLSVAPGRDSTIKLPHSKLRIRPSKETPWFQNPELAVFNACKALLGME